MSYHFLSASENDFPNDDNNETRTPGTLAVRLSTAAVHRVAFKLKTVSPDFLRFYLVETGEQLASVVVPLKDRDEAAFKHRITTNEEVFSEMREKLDSSPIAFLRQFPVAFLRQFCEKTLEIHFSPTGLVSFGLKLDRFLVSDQETGDLVAEAAALALSPQQQLGWERNEENEDKDNVVFASSVSEIDGTGCGITESGCRAIAEGVLEPRKNVDGVWVYNECVRALLLGGNSDLKDAGASAIAAALSKKDTLFKDIFNKTLTVLDLSKCDIGPAGATAIAKALKPVQKRDGSWTFPSNLRALNLSGNRIESRGARGIAGLLGPKKNEKNGEWMFNPSLAVIDLSDQFSDMNGSVAEAFEKALEPKHVERIPGGEGGSVTREYYVNNVLVELNLRNNAFPQENVVRLKKTLDSTQNGSNGTAAASTRLLLDTWPPVNSENVTVTDKHGNSNELVMPIALDNKGHFRPMTYWRWKTWNLPFSASTDNPDKPDAGPPPQRQLTGALAELELVKLIKLPSFGFAIRTELLRGLEDARDNSFSEERGSAPIQGLPEWLDEEDLTCVICQEIFTDPYKVNGCGHTFCFHCISQFFASRRDISCPICRHHPSLTHSQPISFAIAPDNITQTLIERHVLPNLSPDALNERRKRGVEREEKQTAMVAEVQAYRAAVQARNVTR